MRKTDPNGDTIQMGVRREEKMEEGEKIQAIARTKQENQSER
jgi:hypothetical protein